MVILTWDGAIKIFGGSEMETTSSLMDTITQMAMEYGLRILGAILIFLVGRWIAKLAKRYTQKTLDKMEFDEALKRFLSSIAYYLVLVVTIIAVLSTLGVQTTSLVAVLGAATLAIGLALEGALANFAAGVLLLIFRPFAIGDTVEIAGYSGKVEDILIISTIISTSDNKLVTITNSQVTGSPIVNYSRKENRRVDMVFGVSYDDNLAKVKKVLEDVVQSDSRVLADPEPVIAVSELGDSAVNFIVRPFVKNGDYWDVYYDMMEAVKLRFDEENISMPYPQHDVHFMK
jgi:small conductance mechanosensitive channel